MSRAYRSKEQALTYWQKVLRRWQQSGLSAYQFCRMHKISDSGFYTWRNKLAVTQPIPEQEKSADASFVQVDVPTSTQSPLALQLTCGHRLHIGNQGDPRTLAKVIHTLQEAKLC